MRQTSRLASTIRTLGAFGLCASGGAMAQAAPAAEPVLGTVNVISTLTPHSVRETAASVTVIEQQQIEEQLAQNIQDLVRYEPDLSVSRDATRFGSSGFTIRGIGGNRVLELVDGIPVSDTFSIGDYSDAGRNLVDPELVKRVEILRGSASALYGSDAIGGVVSFTTKDPQDYLRAGRPWQALGKAGYNSVDNSAVETAIGAFGNQSDAGMLLFSRRDGQQQDNRGDNGARDFNRTQPNPQNYYDNNFLAKGVFNRRDASYRLVFSGTQGGTDTNVLSSIGSRDLSSSIGAPPGFYVINTRTQDGDDAQRALRLSGEAELRNGGWYERAVLRLYGSDSLTRQATVESRDQTIAGTTTPLLIQRNFSFKQDLIGLGAAFSSGFDTGALHHLLSYGLDFKGTRSSELRDGLQTNQLSGVSSKTVSPDTFPTRDFPVSLSLQGGVYLQDEIALGERLSLIPALRYDYYRLSPDDDSTYHQASGGSAPVGIIHSGVSPKLGLSYDIARAWTAYAQYAHGFRAPPYDNVNVGFTNLTFGYTAIPNPKLKPESSDGVETGLRYEDGGASASASVYYSRYRDFIESYVSLGTDPSTGLLTFQSQNFTAVRIYGADLRGAYAFRSLRGFGVHAALAYTRGDNLQDHAPLNSIDPPKAVLGLDYRDPRKRYGGQFNATLVQRKSRVDDSGGAGGSGNENGPSGPLFKAPGYATFDVTGWTSITPALRLNAGVFNLGNQKYWSWSTVQGQSESDAAIDRFSSPGINGSVALRYSF